ncbi:MAG: hypothetical protein HOJ34_05680 [Kordiimonadaceae bacterium]|nr:hypothetical protein [Kordiimonadaceae bacterium]
MVELSIINFDVTLLGGYYNAKYDIGTSASASTFASRGPAVVTPWSVEDDASLLNRYNKIRTKSTFINENTSAVKAAGFDKDDKALFTLYSALNDLRTIAEYAKADSTSTSLIANLSTQFQGGLQEIDNYVRAAELDKLILMAGEKKSYVTTSATLGKTNNDVNGLAISTGETEILNGLTGNEVFTINISKSSTEQEDIVIDLSQISGDITLKSLKNYINSEIIAGTYSFKSRAQIEEVSDGKFALNFEVEGIEGLSFSAASVDPTLIIAGTTKSSDFGAEDSGTLTEYKNLDGSGLTKSYSNEIVGIDENGFVIPADPDDESSEETASKTTTFQTTTAAVEIDSAGNSYVVGTTGGDFDGQINGATTSDVFLSKYDSVGNLQWSRLLGASDEAEAFDIAIDGNDNVIIAGKTNKELISSDVFSGTDSFVTKYSKSGEEIWTQQLDTIATDQANGLTVNANGDVYFTGQVDGRFDTTTIDNGGSDAIIVKLGGSSGTILETAQFGSAADDYGNEIAIASDGNLLVLAKEDGNAVIRKLDKNNLDTTLATYDIGDLGGGDITGISVVGTEIYISGSTLSGSFSGGSVTNSYSGGKDGFVTKLSDNGGSFAADWTAFVGTSSTDSLAGITAQGGSVYVAGTTSGTLSGETHTGVTDGFVAKIDAATGAIDWQEQLNGGAGYNENTAIAFDANGSSVLDKLGLPSGTINRSEPRDIETQTSLRAGDHFYISVNEGRNIKVDIRAGDTFNTLATRINTLSTRNLKASVTYGDDGPALKFEAKNGAEISFIAGSEGKDALSKLGLEERSILSSDILFNLNEGNEIDPEDLGGVFALGLNNGFSFSDKAEAEYIFTQLQDAINVIESAHRSLTFDPIRAQILQDAKRNIGPAPAYLQDRLARYQDGLQRILQVTGGTVI